MQTQHFQPIEREFGGQFGGGRQEGMANEAGHDGTELEELAEKYEQLRIQMEQYFDDDNPQTKSKIPVVKAPEKFTKEEWLQHQATHTPFARWCKHCLAARMIRHKHPFRGRRAAMLQDIENVVGRFANISIDYMCLHEKGRTMQRQWPQSAI